MFQSSKSFVRKLMFSLLGLGLIVGACQVANAAHAGQDAAIAAKAPSGDIMFYHLVGRKVAVFLKGSNQAHIGQCVDADDNAIAVEINGQVFVWYRNEIHEIHTL